MDWRPIMTIFKMLALDMDGTTLNSKGEITPKTADAINRFTENGVIPVLATGRMSNAIKDHLNKIKKSGLVVSHNGALIEDLGSNEIILKKTIPETIFFQVYNYCKTQNLVFHINEPRAVYSEEKNDLSEKYKSELGIDISYVQRLLSHVTEPISILILGEKERLEILRKDFKTLFGDDVDYVFIPWYEDKWMYQILPKNTSKGDGVTYVANVLGINSETEIISFGDSYNDLEMIETTFLGIAMGNAYEDLKDRSVYITKSNDQDGVAYVLEQLIEDENGFLKKIKE